MPSSTTLPDVAQIDLLDALFDQTAFGMALFSSDLRLLRWNATWAGFISHYMSAPAGMIAAGDRPHPVEPGSGDGFDWPAIFARVLAGQTVREEALPAGDHDATSYWDLTLAPLVHNGDVVGVLELTNEATERIQSYQGLEQRVFERTHELITLLEVAHNMASTLELEPLLNLILDQLRTVVPFDGASILALDGESLQVMAYRGPIPQGQALDLRLTLDDSGANRAVVERQAPVIIADVRGEGSLARSFRETAGPLLETTFGYIRSWMGVPLLHKERLIGMLSLDHGQPFYYTARHGQLALAFAGQVAVALENARLYRAEQARLAEAERRRAVAESLRDILTVLNSDRPLDEILAYIVAQAGRLMGTDTGAV
ncbi:MAG TPA: GAF domain-containing protein, partial [Anaerolineae bacterium]